MTTPPAPPAAASRATDPSAGAAPRPTGATSRPAPVTAADVEAAASRIEGVAHRTPLQRCARLSDAHGAEVWLKREDLQPVRSYKLRGAYNLISQLSDAERASGVVCASAGNHGQGVALACAELRIRGQIYVPSTTPRQKRDRMLQIGGEYVELVVRGDTYDEASAHAKRDAEARGAAIVPAFDDPRTIAGQGTVAVEIIEQFAEATGALPDTLLVPVGGGGLLAGCLAWLAERHPGVRVLGVEPAGAACLSAALDAGGPVELKKIDTFVDGAAVRRAGDITFALARAHAARIVTVPEGRICSEMLALYQTDGIIAEPAGALANAALGLYKPRPGERVVAIVSGGNNDVSRYSEIVERSLVYEGRKHYFLVNFPQEPGALRRFLDEVLGPDDDITLFEYVKRSNRELGPALVGIELGDPRDYAALIARMDASPMTVEVVSPDSPFYRFLV
nr:threonine ammonia-lyase IlvA [Propionibacterium sp.]